MGVGVTILAGLNVHVFAACLMLQLHLFDFFSLIAYVTVGKFSIFQMHIWLVFLVFFISRKKDI